LSGTAISAVRWAGFYPLVVTSGIIPRTQANVTAPRVAPTGCRAGSAGFNQHFSSLPQQLAAIAAAKMTARVAKPRIQQETYLFFLLDSEILIFKFR
jgi:hypothetical protein